MGFHCAERATTGDFLTSLTNPAERIAREGFEHLVPRTPDEFAARWQSSEDRKKLLQDIEGFELEFPLGGKSSCSPLNEDNADPEQDNNYTISSMQGKPSRPRDSELNLPAVFFMKGWLTALD